MVRGPQVRVISSTLVGASASPAIPGNALACSPDLERGGPIAERYLQEIKMLRV
jgi:hypothetical protein